MISCAGPEPILDAHLTKSALEAARTSGASRYAPKLWIQAKREYQRALRYRKQRNYYKARDSLKKSRQWAEEAETKSRLQKSESGELSF